MVGSRRGGTDDDHHRAADARDGTPAPREGGHALLVALDRVELQPAVVVLAVGLHFVPFAAAFDAPVFARLGWTLAGLGVMGLVLGVAAGAAAVAAAAVLAGPTLLVLMTADALSA